MDNQQNCVTIVNNVIAKIKEISQKVSNDENDNIDVLGTAVDKLMSDQDAALKGKGTENGKLNNEINDLKTQLEAEKERADECEDNLTKLIEDTNAKALALKGQLEQQRNEAAAAAARNTEERKAMEAQLDDAKKNINAKEAELNDKNVELSQKEKAAKDAEKEYQDSLTQKDKEKTKELQNQAAAAQQSLLEAQSNAKIAADELEEKNKELQQQQTEKFNSDIKSITEQRDGYRIENEINTKLVSVKEQLIRSKIAELKSKDDEIEKLLKENRELKTNLYVNKLQSDTALDNLKSLLQNYKYDDDNNYKSFIEKLNAEADINYEDYRNKDVTYIKYNNGEIPKTIEDIQIEIKNFSYSDNDDEIKNLKEEISSIEEKINNLTDEETRNTTKTDIRNKIEEEKSKKAEVKVGGDEKEDLISNLNEKKAELKELITKKYELPEGQEGQEGQEDILTKTKFNSTTSEVFNKNLMERQNELIELINTSKTNLNRELKSSHTLIQKLLTKINGLNEKIKVGSSSNSVLEKELELIKANLAKANAEHETKMKTINSILNNDEIVNFNVDISDTENKINITGEFDYEKNSKTISEENKKLVNLTEPSEKNDDVSQRLLGKLIEKNQIKQRLNKVIQIKQLSDETIQEQLEILKKSIDESTFSNITIEGIVIPLKSIEEKMETIYENFRSSLMNVDDILHRFSPDNSTYNTIDNVIKILIEQTKMNLFSNDKIKGVLIDFLKHITRTTTNPKDLLLSEDTSLDNYKIHYPRYGKERDGKEGDGSIMIMKKLIKQKEMIYEYDIITKLIDIKEPKTIKLETLQDLLKNAEVTHHKISSSSNGLPSIVQKLYDLNEAYLESYKLNSNNQNLATEKTELVNKFASLSKNFLNFKNLVDIKTVEIAKRLEILKNKEKADNIPLLSRVSNTTIGKIANQYNKKKDEERNTRNEVVEIIKNMIEPPNIESARDESTVVTSMTSVNSDGNPKGGKLLKNKRKRSIKKYK